MTTDRGRGAPGVARNQEARTLVLELLRALRTDGVVPEGVLADGFRCFTPLHDWLEGDEAVAALANLLGVVGDGCPGAREPDTVVAGEDAVVVELRLDTGEQGAGRVVENWPPCTAVVMLAADRIVEVRCYLDPAALAIGAQDPTAPGRVAQRRAR